MLKDNLAMAGTLLALDGGRALLRSFPSMLTFKSQATFLRQRRASLRIKCQSKKPEFGYTRKDIILIGLGVTVFGVGLKSGLELFGVDSLKAGNVVQLIMVLGLTVGWIFSYIYRVSNKDMTYAKQLKDYELKVMEKRFQELPEAEQEALLAQVEEEKERMRKEGTPSS